jgi:hypothetical protein
MTGYTLRTSQAQLRPWEERSGDKSIQTGCDKEIFTSERYSHNSRLCIPNRAWVCVEQLDPKQWLILILLSHYIGCIDVFAFDDVYEASNWKRWPWIDLNSSLHLQIFIARYWWQSSPAEELILFLSSPADQRKMLLELSTAKKDKIRTQKFHHYLKVPCSFQQLRRVRVQRWVFHQQRHWKMPSFWRITGHTFLQPWKSVPCRVTCSCHSRCARRRSRSLPWTLCAMLHTAAKLPGPLQYQ